MDGASATSPRAAATRSSRQRASRAPGSHSLRFSGLARFTVFGARTRDRLDSHKPRGVSMMALIMCVLCGTHRGGGVIMEVYVEDARAYSSLRRENRTDNKRNPDHA